MKLDGRTFNATDFVVSHKTDYVVFVSGGWNYLSRTAYYCCLLCCGPHRKKIEETLENQSSANAAMLIGAYKACALFKRENKKMYLFSPTALGFQKARKGKGPNVELVHKLLDLCVVKNIELVDIDLHDGGQLIRKILDGSCEV